MSWWIIAVVAWIVAVVFILVWLKVATRDETPTYRVIDIDPPKRQPGHDVLFGTSTLEEDLWCSIEEVVEHHRLDVREGFRDSEILVIEWSTELPGESGNNSLPSGADIAERVAEDFADDCFFEGLASDYADAAKDAEVIAAFQRARDLMASHQRFLVARTEIAHHRVRIDPQGTDWNIEESIRL